MKTIKLCFLLLGFIFLMSHSRAAHAQSYTITYFQCDPVSCTESTGVVTTGTASVDVIVDCSTPSGPFDYESYGKVALLNCTSLYEGTVTISRGTIETTDPNDCGLPNNYNVDYSKIVDDISGAVPYYDELTIFCNGSTVGPTASGTKAC